MKLGCPICNSKFTLAQAVHEAAMKEMVDLAAKLGNNWGLVFDYTECFRQEAWGSVREQKRLRLLKEIWRLFEKCEFDIDGKRYRTDWPRINAAIRAVTDADKFGFKNHNYLKRVLLGEKAEKLSAEGLSAREETEREEKRRSASGPEGPTPRRVVKDGQGLEEDRRLNIDDGLRPRGAYAPAGGLAIENQQSTIEGQQSEITAGEYKKRKGIGSLVEGIGRKD